jgi:nicotinamidase/pyrazinamidase
MTSGTGLIIVDVQNDFVTGSLAVPEAVKVIEPLNKVISALAGVGAPIIYTRDWHPADHCSFKDYGGIWPPHCVKNSWGAAFYPGLLISSTKSTIISKATIRDKEAYSGFQGTDLDQFLKTHPVKTLVIGGLATDYCVKNTVLDAIKLGYSVIVVSDGVKAVDPANRALEALRDAGAGAVTSTEIVRQFESKV